MEFGPLALWEQMTILAKVVVVVLIILSIWSLYVTIERAIVYRKSKRDSLKFARIASGLLKKGDIKIVYDEAGKYPNSHLPRVTRAGLARFMLDPASTQLNLDPAEAAKRAIEREILLALSDLRRGVGGMATIATTSPFIGLFGTVIGIINAFRGMAVSGSGGIGAVSAGIAEALVTTALGLFVAIPAAWMFNQFTGTLERFQVEMSNSGSELVDFFIRHLAAENQTPRKRETA